MATGYHVNGTAFVYVGVGGGGSLAELGYTVDGVDIDFSKNTSDIITDVMGPMTPQDIQDMGEVATITCPFIVTDRDVLSAVMNRGDRAAVGFMNTPGLVLGLSGNAFSVGIASPADAPWYFSTCILKPSARVKLATKANPFTLTFYAWPYIPPTTATGHNAPLYLRSLA